MPLSKLIRTMRTIPALLCCLLLLASAPPGASAARDQETVFDATNDLLRATSESSRQAILDELRLLGVDTLRIIVPWRNIVTSPDSPRAPASFAPTNPAAYSGGELNSIDESIRGAHARGMRVLLTPSGPMPDWASASGASSLANPEPQAFEELVTALGRRYDGTFGSECVVPPATLCLPGQRGPIPRVDYWSAWNEPNQKLFLRPQLRRGRPYSPQLYRRLFIAAQRGLAASGHGGDTLLIGETAPSGGRDGVDPIDFLRGVLCLDRDYRRRPSCEPIEASGWAHHPYSLGDAPYRRTPNPGLINMATIGRMVKALARAARPAGSASRLPIYATEYGVQSVPDSDGVSLARQAEYIGIGEYLMWRNPQIRAYSQYLLSDDRASYQYAFESGLITEAGVRKPAYAAFQIPLVARRTGGLVRFWGHVRPGDSVREVELQARRPDGTVAVIRRLATDASGYFQLQAARAGSVAWRAVCELPDGRVLTGPFVRSHVF